MSPPEWSDNYSWRGGIRLDGQLERGIGLEKAGVNAEKGLFGGRQKSQFLLELGLSVFAFGVCRSRHWSERSAEVVRL